MLRYDNTPENAVSVGWAFCPDYHLGHPDCRYVVHDTKHGVFIFTDAATDHEGDDPFDSSNDTAEQFRLRGHKLRLMGYVGAADECVRHAAKMDAAS